MIASRSIDSRALSVLARGLATIAGEIFGLNFADRSVAECCLGVRRRAGARLPGQVYLAIVRIAAAFTDVLRPCEFLVSSLAGQRREVVDAVP